VRRLLTPCPAPEGRVRTSVIVCISVLYLLCSVARKVLAKLDWTADTHTEVQRKRCRRECPLRPALPCPVHYQQRCHTSPKALLLATTTTSSSPPPTSSFYRLIQACIDCMILHVTNPQLTYRLLPCPCTVGQGLHQRGPPSPTGSARIVRPRARQPWFTQPKTCASSASTREPDPSLRASTETGLRELHPPTTRRTHASPVTATATSSHQ
jgi:hypothetical protein